MRTIIIGAGKVGYSIAQMLASQKQDVVVIEQDPERRKVVEESLDVQVIAGNGASLTTLHEAGAKEAGLLVAVTESDELNMVACLFAKSLGVKRTVARVRNPDYVDNASLTQINALGIDLIINPEHVTARLIAQLVEVPEALNVEYFANGHVQLVELPIGPEAPVVGRSLQDLRYSHPFLIAAILRNGKMLVPRGEDHILAGDQVFLVTETRQRQAIEALLGRKRIAIQSVFVLGGGRLGFYLAKLLENRNISVKIMDKDLEKCRSLCSQLPNTTVLCGDGTDLNLLEQEDAGRADLFVAVTGDDKVNLLVSLLAKHLGVKRAIAQIRRSDYIPLVQKVGIDVAVSPRLLTAGAILKYIRRGDIISINLLEGAKAETIELVAHAGMALGKPLKGLKFPKGALIGALVRQDKVIIPSGNDHLEDGDRVIIFTLPQAAHKVEAFFAGH